MTKTFSVLLVISCLWLSVSAQELQTLVPSRPLEREIAGNQTHTYRIELGAGQFVRLVLEQKGIDLALDLTAPDGKQLAVINLTRPGGVESLSAETQVSGAYQLRIRALSPSHIAGAYLLQMETRSPSTEDMQRINAEGMLVQANPMVSQSNTATRAIELLDKALPLWRAMGDRYWEANTLNLLARAYSSISSHEKAIEYAERGLALHRHVKNSAGQGSALNTIGTAYDALGKYEKAVEYRDQALAAVREVKDRAAEAIILSNLTMEYDNLGRPEKTIEHAEQAVLLLREAGNRVLEGRSLRNLGRAYQSMGRSETALEYFEQALAIARDVKDRWDESATLKDLSDHYVRQGRIQTAREYAEKALAVAREAKSRLAELSALNSLGITYHHVGQFEKGIEYFEQALAIARELKSRPEELVELSNIGNDLLGLDRKEEAVKYFESALIIAREMNLRYREGQGLVLLGAAYIGLNDEEAKKCLEQALTITREVKDRLWELEALNKLARLYKRLRSYDRAKEFGLQALAIARETKFTGSQVDVLSILAEVERDLGNLAGARNIIEEASQITESVRSQTLVHEARSTLSAYRWYVYEIQVDVLMRLHKANPSRGFDALAVEANERNRARGLLEMLRESGADIRRGVDAALLDRELALARKLSVSGAARTQLLNRPQTAEQAAALAREISQIEHDYDGVRAEIRRTSPRYAALTQPQPLKLKEIQTQLDADTMLLEYALGEERSYLWAITKDSLTSYELPKGELIDKNARQLYQLLTARSIRKRGESALQRQERILQAEANLPLSAQSLSQTLLAPVAAQLGKKRLVIVTDGALQYVPFAMLPDPRRGEGERGRRAEGATGRQGDVAVSASPGRPLAQSAPRPVTKSSSRPLALTPLIVNHELVSVTSASALAIQRAELAGRRAAPKMLAVIADPVFDRTDSRLKSIDTNANDQEQDQTIAFHEARSIEHLAEKSDDKSGKSRLIIPRLPYTRQEAKQLMALTSKTSSLEAIDFKASRDTILSPELSQYRYVHFATHGLLDSERPGLSALVLSMVDEQGKPRDGFLRANDIYNLKLPAELVVLSACQTGLGKEIKGEGLVGLTRGFMYAGAARVVVSLWSVNDKATSELMTKFYERMLKQGNRPAAALRAAQVEMWKQKQWQSPYYWAAFTMQGEWR